MGLSIYPSGAAIVVGDTQYTEFELDGDILDSGAYLQPNLTGFALSGPLIEAATQPKFGMFQDTGTEDPAYQWTFTQTGLYRLDGVVSPSATGRASFLVTAAGDFADGVATAFPTNTQTGSQNTGYVGTGIFAANAGDYLAIQSAGDPIDYLRQSILQLVAL